ncbi:MAG: SlyX family protein, partial [Parafilimonas terrae]|nr:SlyX family protein [Parafilimonas terrae]
MNDPSRIDRLEMRLTEQEATIDDLNRTVTEQWQVIDRLRRAIQALQEQVEEAAARSAPRGASD